MAQLLALIFDVDGTLAETERDGHRLAFNRAFADAELDWDWSIDLYGELLEITGGKERIQFYLDRHKPEFQPPESAVNLKSWIAELHRAKTAHYKQLLAEGLISTRPGVKRLLQDARHQGTRLAIATTTTPENVLVLLETAIDPDAPHWFEVIAAGDIVPAKKPAPDIYCYVLQAMDLDPQNCLAIEDSQQGLQAALQAGLKTVITVNDYTRQQDFSGATLVLDHLGEVDRPFEIIGGDLQYELQHVTQLDLELARKLCQK